MSFNTALTSGNYDSLRGTAAVRPRYRGKLYMSVLPNTTIFAAQVNGSPTPGSAQVTYDTVTTGAYTDIVVGMLVLIGTTSDRRKAEFVGRVRKAPTSSILYINQTDYNILDNYYIFVIDDYRLQARLSRESSGTHYKDYELTPQGLPPVIVGLRSAYADEATSGFYQIAFSLSSSYAAQYGATISTYSTDIEDGTLVSGSLSTATFTAKWPPGFRWIHVTVTDSGGRSTTRRVPIWVHDSSTLPSVYADDIQVNGSIDGGWSASCSAFSGVDTLLDGTLVCFWSRDSYNGTAGTITGNNIAFVGRLRNDSVERSPDGFRYIPTARLQFDGLAAQLARITAASYVLQDVSVSAISNWNSVYALTIWRAIIYLLAWETTALTLFDITFDSTDNTYAYNELGTQLGDMMGAVNDLAFSINGQIVMAADGRIEITRDAGFLSSSARNALTTVAAWTTEDKFGEIVVTDPVHGIGAVVADGGVYFAGTTDSFKAIAPGLSPDDAPGQQPLDKQILAATPYVGLAQLELNQRAADAIGKLWGGVEITVNHPAGYWWLQPSLAQWYTHTYAADLRGRSYTASTRWLLREISFSANNRTGARPVRATYRKETSGDLSGLIGRYLPRPKPGEFVPDDMPPIDAIIPIIEPTPPIDWSIEVSYFPESLISLHPGDSGSRGRFYGATTDANVFEVSFPSGVRTFTDKSPDDDIRAAVGDAICLKFDAWKYKRYFIYGSRGIACIEDLVNGTSADWRMVTTAYNAGIEDCAAIDLTATNPSVTQASLAQSVTGFIGYDPLEIGTFALGTGWQSTAQESTFGGGGQWIDGLGLNLHFACPVKWNPGGPVDFTGTFNFTDNLFVQAFYKDSVSGEWVSMAGSNVPVTTGSGTYSSISLTTNTAYATDIALLFRRILAFLPAQPQFTITQIDFTGTCTFEDCDAPGATEENIGDFQPLLNKQKGYCWLVKRFDSGVAYVYFYVTTNNFVSISKTRVALWVANVAYSITVDSFNWKNIVVTAGDPAGSDAFAYLSIDGGGSWSATTAALLTRGGQLWRNWSTTTPNVKNTTTANDVMVRGLDGSNNLTVRYAGLTGSDNTVATGSGKYGATALSLWIHPRDLDFQIIALQDNTPYIRSSATGSWTLRTTIPGGSSNTTRGVMGFSKGVSFYLVWGYRTLAWTHDRGVTWVNAYSDWETFRSGAYGSEGETIASMCVDYSTAYPIPVAG